MIKIRYPKSEKTRTLLPTLCVGTVLGRSASRHRKARTLPFSQQTRDQACVLGPCRDAERPGVVPTQSVGPRRLSTQYSVLSTQYSVPTPSFHERLMNCLEQLLDNMVRRHAVALGPEAGGQA